MITNARMAHAYLAPSADSADKVRQRRIWSSPAAHPKLGVTHEVDALEVREPIEDVRERPQGVVRHGHRGRVGDGGARALPAAQRTHRQRSQLREALDEGHELGARDLRRRHYELLDEVRVWQGEVLDEGEGHVEPLYVGTEGEQPVDDVVAERGLADLERTQIGELRWACVAEGCPDFRARRVRLLRPFSDHRVPRREGILTQLGIPETFSTSSCLQFSNNDDSESGPTAV